MSARVWRIAFPSLLMTIVLFAADASQATRFQPPATLRIPASIENASIKPAERIDPVTLVEDPEVAALFAHLFQLAWFGTRDLERAAFLVREPDDTWSCLLWPANAGFRSEEFQGRVPDGVVAIVHTHPNRMPLASLQDSQSAVATGLPLFTLTWANITVVDERTGEETRIMRNRDWRKKIPASTRDDCRCREMGSEPRPLREGLFARQ